MTLPGRLCCPSLAAARLALSGGKAAVAAAPAARSPRLLQQAQRRRMGGGGAYMHVDEGFKAWGEAFGVVCWLWVFHRARSDLPVFLGLRHPWEHAEDPFFPHVHHVSAASPEAAARHASWDKFSAKSLVQSDEDDDEEEEEEDEEGEGEEEDED